ncbi:hypothetical protein ERJ75_000801800 [Trypanosoma vivax]|nr:hypothetical protein ERJ75_000801800 [Trypanosoma vivax]
MRGAGVVPKQKQQAAKAPRHQSLGSCAVHRRTRGDKACRVACAVRGVAAQRGQTGGAQTYAFAGTPTPELKKAVRSLTTAVRRGGTAWASNPGGAWAGPTARARPARGIVGSPVCTRAARARTTRAGEKNSGTHTAWTCAPERDEGGTRDACGGQHLRAGGGTSIKAGLPKGRQTACVRLFRFATVTRGDNCETNCVSRTR